MEPLWFHRYRERGRCSHSLYPTRKHLPGLSNGIFLNRKSHRKQWLEVAESIEMSNLIISDMIEFVDVAEELINADLIK